MVAERNISNVAESSHLQGLADTKKGGLSSFCHPKFHVGDKNMVRFGKTSKKR